MSRSRKHRPITGIAICRSEKEYKTLEHRRLRVALRQAMARLDYDRASFDRREDIWLWGKDGKTDWAGTSFEQKARRK